MNFPTRIFPIVLALLLASGSRAQSPAADGQSAAHPASTSLCSTILQPALSNVQSTTAALNISRWKAPASVRDAAQQNVDSIQRDLGNTLPGLIAQADDVPASVPPSFAVYRNVDALYDVLLRVSETADLAAPADEADSVANSLQKLEGARKELSDSILRASEQQQSQLAALQSAANAVKAVPVEPSKTVVDDGPVTTPKPAKKKTAAKKPAPKPPASAPAPTPPS